MTELFSEIVLTDDGPEVERRYGHMLTDPVKIEFIGGEVEDLAERFAGQQDPDIVSDIDFTDESLERIDALLNQWLLDQDEEEVDEAGNPEVLEPVIIDVGSYLARVIHENLGGQWRFRRELVNTSLYFGRLGLECFPYHQVMKRIALGPDESLSQFYENLVNCLCND